MDTSNQYGHQIKYPYHSIGSERIDRLNINPYISHLPERVMKNSTRTTIKNEPINTISYQLHPYAS